jgi:alkyl hydroperoxide reductase subunit D
MAPVIEEAQDQKALFDNIAKDSGTLTGNNLKYTAWAAAYACRDKSVLKLVGDTIGPLDTTAKRDVKFATMRMAVTNPYFFSRQFVQTDAGGTLQDLNLRGFDTLNVADETAYHYACLAISMINGGYVCFASHTNSLQQSGESAKSIDTAMRLTSAINAMRQLAFLDPIEH